MSGIGKDTIHLRYLAQPPAPRSRRTVYILALVITYAIILAVMGMIFSEHPMKRQVCANDFHWDDLQPRRILSWHNCYGIYKCARLRVPLDYSDPEGVQAAIALYKLPASVDQHHKDYRGPILINPGGPGNPPFTMLQSSGNRFQTILGSEYDIVAFDPRGVGYTTPPVFGFNDSAERETWTLLEPPLINSSSDSLSKRIGRAKVINKLIKQQSGDVLEHVNSAVVARDMLSIVQAHGRSQLQYWGQSYGAILGLTYANLFPEHVGPMVLDGIPDANDYYSTQWASNLADTSKTVQAFYDACASAGPSRCAFYRETPREVRSRIEDLYAIVRAHPIPGFESGTGVYGVVDYSTMHQAFHDALYRPYDDFPDFAQALAELEAGNGTRILARTHSQRSWCPKCNSTPRWNGYRLESRLATMCTDGEPVTDSEAELLAHYERLAQDSSFADIWASFRLGCSGWDVRPKWPVSGPFTGNTSFPLLFIGNTADPVAPLRPMRDMSSNHSASVLLIQNAFGHCSTVAPSKCTNDWVRRYFRAGKLPPDFTVCEVDAELFRKVNNTV